MRLNTRSMPLYSMFLILVVACTVVACGNDSPSSDGSAGSGQPKTFTNYLAPWVGLAPWFIADKKGFDRDNGLNMKLVKIVLNKEGVPALTSGRLNSGTALTAEAVRFAEAGMPIRPVLFQDMSVTADAILAQPGIDSIEDLKGKRVGYEKGGGAEGLLLLALKRAGLTVEDIVPVEITPDAAGAALVSRRVDAAASYEPYINQLRAKGKAFKIVATAGDFPGVISDVWTASDKSIEENPEAVVAALKSWDAGVAYLRKNPKESERILADEFDTTLEGIRLSMRGVRIFDLEQSLAFFKEKMPALLKETSRVQKELGNLNRAPDFSEMYTTEFLERAIAD